MPTRVSMIWQRVAKDVHVSLSILLFGLCDAVRHFNDGNRSTADISKEKGIEPGHHTLVACCTRDQYRVKKAQHQSTGEAKHLRKNRQAATKAKGELVAAKYSPSYEPGGV
ncbi:hypothetical protein HPB50_007909 [Hyalomma asiaticum]|uniref:Uncharacterized protein n=1 Tax=Hyalomma asiaticum TaxID=266040 RepID=A0ACB7TEU6_HYAAI|nr:hypothetical protein HPB50_007909 [Hyalomma asiaticum]